jgi:F-type H+-transporting ATPase subunit b
MLSINISELIWTVINFLLLLLLLKRFLYRPICEFMDARQARIDAGLEKEQAAQEALRAEQARQDEDQQTARAQARALLQQEEARNAQESREALLATRQDVREAEKLARERMQEHSRQEEKNLSQAEPALAELLAGRLLQEEGDGQ